MENILSGNLFDKQITIKKVSKSTAKKHFAEGKQVYLQSSKLRPFNCWQSICPITIDRIQLDADISVNQFSIDL